MRNNRLLKLALTAALSAGLACGKKIAPEPEAGAQPVTAVVKTEKSSSKASFANSAYEKKETYFKLPAVAGGEIDLASYAGKPVLFMLFTETCPYCRKAAPALERIHKVYGPKGLNVLGICIQEDPQAAKNFASDMGLTFPLAYSGRPVYTQYRAQGVPFIFLLDASHKIAAVWPGYDPSFDSQLVKAVETMLVKK